MTQIASRELVAHLVNPSTLATFDVLGPTIQFVTSPEAGDHAPCIMRGTIPAGVFVPLHSHPDPETFVMISGEVEGLSYCAEAFRWQPIRPCEVFHVPGGAKHAFRNPSREPAVMILISTPKIGRFFREIGAPLAPGEASIWPPSEDAIHRLSEIAERYGHWVAMPEENAEIGLSLPPVPLTTHSGSR